MLSRVGAAEDVERQRDRETETERQRERETETERQRDRESDRQTDRQTETELYTAVLWFSGSTHCSDPESIKNKK